MLPPQVKKYLEACADGDELTARKLVVSGDSMKEEAEEALKKAKAVDCTSSGNDKVDGDTTKVKVIKKDRDGNKEVA